MNYDFDPADVENITSMLDNASRSAGDRIVLWSQLCELELYRSMKDQLRVEVDLLFAFELQEDFSKPGRVELAESNLSQTSTRPIVDMPASVGRLWAAVGKNVNSPVAGALIADLILTSRFDVTPEHATATVELYLAASAGKNVSTMQCALYLARANHIARSRRMAQEAEVRATMRQVAATLSGEDGSDSATLTLLSALSLKPRGGVFEDGEREWLRSQLFTLGNNGHFVDEIASALWRLSKTRTERDAAGRWHVQAHISFARMAGQGMQKMYHAKNAAELAEKYSLLDLRDVSTRIMQSIDQESMGWQVASADMVFSKNVFRVHLWKYRKSRNWKHAIDVFLQGGPPSGDHEKNKRLAESNARGSIRCLISRVTFGMHGLPERTNADFLKEEVDRTEVLSLNTSAMFLALELDYIFDRFSLPRNHEVSDWMVARFATDAGLARNFHEVLTAYSEGRYSDSSRLAIPLIESAARTLLIALDEPLYHTERGHSPGQFPAMDFYIEALANQGMEANWIRSLRIALLSSGMNMRNLFAHGFMLEFTPDQAALLIRLAGLMCSMPVYGAASRLRSPGAVGQRRLRRSLRWVWSWA